MSKSKNHIPGMKSKRPKDGLTRRRFVQASGAGLAAAAASTSFPAILKAAKKPLVIGLQTEMTGILATTGYWYDKAAKAAVARVNKMGGIAGRKVEYVVENTTSKVDVGVPAIEKLVKRGGADFIIGSIHTGIAIGSAKLCRDLKTLYFSCAKSQQVTGAAGNRYLFRITSNSEMEAQATVSPALIREMGKKWSIVYVDYSWGQSHQRVWKPRLEKAGAEIVSEVGIPLGTSDLVPYLAKVNPSTEAALVALFTSDAIGFTKQRKSMGLDFKVAGVQGVDTGIAPSVLKDAVGFTLPHSLPRELAYLDTPHNRALRDACGVDPMGKEIGGDHWITESYYWTSWEYVNLIKKAVEAADWGDRSHNRKMVEALEGMSLKESDDFPQGSKTIRAEDHQAFIDMYYSRIEAGGRVKVLRKLPRDTGLYPAYVDYRKEDV